MAYSFSSQGGYQGNNNGYQGNNGGFQPVPPTQNVQPLFPQPQGNVYNINSTLEVANVPVGAGISVALCMAENTMFIKTMQNGNPMFYPYKILPYSNEAQDAGAAAPEIKEKADYSTQIQECIDRISAIENELKQKKKGVDFDV